MCYPLREKAGGEEGKGGREGEEMLAGGWFRFNVQVINGKPSLTTEQG